MNGLGGRSTTGWSLVFAMAFATPAYAQDAGSADRLVVPNIKWSLSGDPPVRAPASRSEEAPAGAAPARKASAKPPAAKKPVTARPVLASPRAKPAPPRPIARTAAPARPVVTRVARPTKPAPPRPVVRTAAAPRPAVARVAPLAVKPVTVKAPTRPIVAPPPVAVQPSPARPPPSLVDESEPGLVTIHPLTPRKVTEDESSFGHAVAAVASHTQGIPRLRPTVGVLALAAALLGLIAIWWQSVGARMWGMHRRRAQPKLMIDIPLAEQPQIAELALPEAALDRENA